MPQLPGMVSRSVSHALAGPHPKGHILDSQQTAPCSLQTLFVCVNSCSGAFLPWWAGLSSALGNLTLSLSPESELTPPSSAFLRHTAGPDSLCFVLMSTYLYAFPTLSCQFTALGDFLLLLLFIFHPSQLLENSKCSINVKSTAYLCRRH